MGTFRYFLFPGSERKTSQDKLQRALRNFIDNLHAIERVKCESDVTNIKKCFQNVQNHLPGPITVQKLCKIDDNIINSDILDLYSQLLSSVIRLLLPQWPLFKEEVVNIFVLEESFETSEEMLLILTGFLKNENDKTVLEAIAFILLKYVKSDAVLTAIIDCSCLSFEEKTELYKLRSEWENYVQLLATLPERVANRLEIDTPKEFSHENYAYSLLFHVIRSIDFMSECSFNQGIQYDISYLSHLLSKVIINYNMSGTSEAILKFIDILIAWTGNENKEKSKFIKRKLIQTLLFHLNRQAIDCLSIILLKQCAIDYRAEEQAISNILGDNFDKSKDWNEILTLKIPFYVKPKDYKETQIVENLIFYLSTTNNRSEALSNLILRVSNAWADVKLTNTSDISQHMYLSQLLVLAVKYHVTILLQNKNTWQMNDLKTILFKGMSKHLNVLSQEFRCVGMSTTEIILKTLSLIEEKDKEAVENLKFDYAEMGKTCVEIHDVLNDLASKCLIDDKRKIPNDFNIKTVNLKASLDYIAERVIEDRPVHNTIVSCAVKTTEQTKEIVKTIISAKLDALDKNVTEDLDSDDDLQPYDMSNDISISAKKRPHYIRDLIEIITEEKDQETFEATLEISEELVTKQLKNEDPKLATDLLDLFTHLEAKFHVDNFDSIKFNTAVAIVCSQPKVTAPHICKEIHTDIGRYSIATKIFMLDVLSEAANRIADVRPNIEATPKSEVITTVEDKEIPAEEIIRRRLINKTRYFHSLRPHPFSKAKRNEFAAVSDSFFYPLVSGFGYKQLTLSHHNLKQDIDSILLYKYLSVVGNIILASKNCPKCPKYCSEIIEITMYMRYNSDPKIQSCIIALVASIVLALPPSILKGEFFNAMMEFRSWLADLLTNVDLTMRLGGPKSETAIFAGQILHLIEKNLSEGD